MTNPILVALDVPATADAIALAEKVNDHVGGFKIGLELLMGENPDLIGQIRSMGKPVFVDAKLHDIPHTVAGAARQLGSAGARWVTVHASGGREMMEAAVSGLAGGSTDSDAGILAVTVLTSLGDLGEVGVPDRISDQVGRLATLAAASGVEGLVCAASELAVVRSLVPDLIRVVPGIRPTGSEADDQARVATPHAAVAAGATYLVIGRAISRAVDPAKAAEQITRTILEGNTSGG